MDIREKPLGDLEVDISDRSYFYLNENSGIVFKCNWFAKTLKKIRIIKKKDRTAKILGMSHDSKDQYSKKIKREKKGKNYRRKSSMF